MPKGKTRGRDRFDVVIAGAGFVGRTLALALAKLAPQGFRIALVDAEPARAEGSGVEDTRALALSAATRNLLSVLDLWPVLAPQAQAIEAIEITDSSLNAALRPHFLGFDDELRSDGASAFMVEHNDLVRVLAAADGKRSQLRERAGIKCVGWSYPQMGIVTTVAHARPHHGKAVQHFLPSGPFAMLPLKGNRSSIVWTEEKARGEAIMAADEAGFLDELTKRFGLRLGA